MRKPLFIFKDFIENLSFLTEILKENPKYCVKTMHVKIVDLEKFLKISFCWGDRNGRIENSKLFKVGDVGYINLIEPNGEDIPDIILGMFAEYLGVERFEGLPIDIYINLQA